MSGGCPRNSKAAHVWSHHHTGLHARLLLHAHVHGISHHWHACRTTGQCQIAEASEPWSHGGHHVVWHIVVWSALLLLLLFFLFLRLLVQCIYSVSVFSHNLDEVRHGKIHVAALPGQLQGDIWANQIIAGVQACCKALLHVFLHKVLQQAFSQVLVSTGHSTVHAVLVHLVLLSKFNGLLVTLVLLIDQGRNTTHLDKFMLLQFLGQSNLIEVVELLDALSQLLVLLTIHVDVIDGLIHWRDVVLLHLFHVGHDQRQLASLLDLLNNSSVIDLWCNRAQE
mmetsp:Transcript_52686/g.84093  ORF Transcript_52686/g.84093 Transcript_52686/m.84093 type:complete len:281 (-) Transcript_52686:2667-3509(-)